MRLIIPLISGGILLCGMGGRSRSIDVDLGIRVRRYIALGVRHGLRLQWRNTDRNIVSIAVSVGH